MEKVPSIFIELEWLIVELIKIREDTLNINITTHKLVVRILLAILNLVEIGLQSNRIGKKSLLIFFLIFLLCNC